MKLFAAFIWFYLRILPSEKADFCAPDATLRTLSKSTTGTLMLIASK